MNLKNLFRGKTNTDEAAAIEAMAARLTTLASCQALEQELTAQHDALPGFSRQKQQLRRKLEELQRVQKAFALEEDRGRVAAVVKADREEATKAVKAAEHRLKLAYDASAAAAGNCVSRQATIDQIGQQLSELHAQADQAVAAAEAVVRDVIADGQQGAQAEGDAFASLKQAQLHRATCGDGLAARAREHEAELRRLKVVASSAAAQLLAAQDDCNLWRLKLARIDYDQAAQLVVDAYLKMRALPCVDSSGRAFALPNVPPINLTFASRERAVLGTKVCGEHAGLRDFALADLARALLPANLAVLAEPLCSEEPAEADAPPPNPHTFLPGSVEYENAKEAQQRFAMGAEQYEASLRAEQREPLQA